MSKQMKIKSFSNIELSAFCGQMALILQSGISSIEGISIMLEDSSSEEEKQVLADILEDLQTTGNLADSLESTGLFPSYLIQMVRIGEETGTLDEVMKALNVHYEREDSIMKSIRNTVTYPIIMVGMMIAVILVLIVKVMPIFNQVFIQLGTEMTGFSRVLMNLGNTINRYSIVFIVLVLLLIAAILYCTRTSRGKQVMYRLGFHIASVRRIYDEIAICRFASGMALTLHSGLNPERSMELVSSLNEDERFQEKLKTCETLINDGEDLSKALHDAGIFTGIYTRMASVGSKTGTMDQVMDHIAELCQDELDTRMNNALAILEPSLVIALSLIVGVILLSVMFPLIGIMSSI